MTRNPSPRRPIALPELPSIEESNYQWRMRYRKEGKNWVERHWPGIDRRLFALAACLAVIGIASGLLAFLTSKDASTAIYVVAAAAFFLLLAFLTHVPVAFGKSLPTRRLLALAVSFFGITCLLAFNYYLLMVITPARDIAEEQTYQPHKIDWLIIKENKTRPADEQIPLLNPPDPELLPFANAKPFAWVFPEPKLLTLPNGETIESHIFENQEEAIWFYGLWLPLVLTFAFSPTIWLSAPFVNLIIASFDNTRYFFYGVFFLAMLLVLTAIFLPSKLGTHSLVIHTSILGILCIGTRILLGCAIDNKTFLVGVHLWAIICHVFLQYFAWITGFFSPWGLLLGIVVIAWIVAELLLPSLLSLTWLIRYRMAKRVLALVFNLIPLFIIFCLPHFLQERQVKDDNPLVEWKTIEQTQGEIDANASQNEAADSERPSTSRRTYRFKSEAFKHLNQDDN